LMFWELSRVPGRYPAGRYVVLYQGEGTITYTPNIRRVESSPGREVVEVDPTRGGFGLFITAVNPQNYLRHIQVRMPITGTAVGIFNPLFIERIKNYRVLRFMPWMFGHSQQLQQRRWADRPQIRHARWSDKGAPLEVMVALSNRLHAAPWFNMSHVADDDYVRRFAQQVKQLLDPQLKVYVEHSNEVWNGQYPQARYAQEQGLALGLSQNPFEAQMRYHARRSRQIFAIWEEVFGPNRLVRVLATQASNAWTSRTALRFENTYNYVDALAIAPYFSVHPDEQAQVRNMTLNQFMEHIRTVLLPRVKGYTSQQQAVASEYTVDLIAYEAGQHLVATGPYQDDPVLNALYDAANRSPRMGLIYSRYLQDWTEEGGQLLVHLTNCSVYNKWGRFGSLEYLAQSRWEAPKYDALQRFIEGG
ncbi:MAG: hypothetical protein M3347_02655, partial [Armatimonadota bacterium]|nr:hypothetical protein [Armatimonadota bacterium]